MDQRIDRAIETNVQKYIKKVKEHYNVEKAILFGSYAKGINNESSDIDIAIVSSDINDRYDDMAVLMGLTWGIDTRIEPHPIRLEDYESGNDYFVQEIIKTGINIM